MSNLQDERDAAITRLANLLLCYIGISLDAGFDTTQWPREAQIMLLGSYIAVDIVLPKLKELINGK